MSTRTTLRPFSVISAGDMSQTTITSSPTVLQSLSRFSYSLTWSGTSPVGTLAVQVSNDYALNPDGSVANAGTWNTIDLNYQGAIVQSVPVSGNTGNGYIAVDAVSGFAARLVYTKASGTGTLTAKITGKVA